MRDFGDATPGPSCIDAFLQRWYALVRECEVLGVQGPDASRAIDIALSRGLSDAAQVTDVPALESQVECARVVIERSGLFDANHYATFNQDVLEEADDPLGHFCRIGWQELRNPSRTFDLWWYWVEHLDPTRDLVNPLVHLALEGRRRGLTSAPRRQERGPTALETAAPRRVCLFASYDPEALVDDTVIAFVRELGRHAHVYLLADYELDPVEQEKLSPYVKAAWGIRHGAYDFGSYSLLARQLVGWEEISRYDELLLVNDSCYLVDSLDAVFAEMASRPCDWWGLQATLRHFASVRRDEADGPIPFAELVGALPDVPPRYDDHPHVGSYFLAFRSPVIADTGFRRRLDHVATQANKRDIVRRYETGLCRYLVATGFHGSTFIEEVHPFHPVYSATAWQLLAEGFPLLKRQLLASNPLSTPNLAEWKERLAVLAPGADTEAIQRNLLRTSDPAQRHRGMSIVTHSGGVRRLAPWPIDQLRDEDERTPTYEHWWAFPASEDGALTADVWAVLGETSIDPSLRKVVLTQRRHLEVAGKNLVVLPLHSREGQWHLLRSAEIISGGPGLHVEDLGLDPRFHQVRDVTAEGPVPPQADLFGRSRVELPDHLARQEARLVRLLRGRRLMLWLVRDGDLSKYEPRDLAALGDVCRDLRLVVVTRGFESRSDEESALSLWGPVERIDAAPSVFPDLVVMLRVAEACLTESTDLAGSFSTTGRPIRPAVEAAQLLHDLYVPRPTGATTATYHAQDAVRRVRTSWSLRPGG